MTRSRSACLLAATAALAACVTDEAPDTSVSSIPLKMLNDGCNTFHCGSNSARVGAYPFHELRTDGQFNSRDDGALRIVSFTREDLTPMAVDVNRGQLRGRTAAGELVTGEALEGSVLVLANRLGGRYDVRLVEVAGIEPWVGSTRPFETYYFQVTVQGEVGVPRDLCPGVGLGHDYAGDAGANDSFAGNEHVAVIYAGDRYDAVTKTIMSVGSRTKPYFNIACAGTAMSKLFLLRHTDASSDATHRTRVSDRQAMLKLIVADYCGTGRSFTADGEPLNYTDAKGWHPMPLPWLNFEAAWDQHGARCLDEPRRLVEEDDAELWAEILAECGGELPPPCYGGEGQDGYAQSANP